VALDASGLPQGARPAGGVGSSTRPAGARQKATTCAYARPGTHGSIDRHPLLRSRGAGPDAPALHSDGGSLLPGFRGARRPAGLQRGQPGAERTELQRGLPGIGIRRRPRLGVRPDRGQGRALAPVRRVQPPRLPSLSRRPMDVRRPVHGWCDARRPHLARLREA